MLHISLGCAAPANQLSVSFWICGRHAKAKYPDMGNPWASRMEPASKRVLPVVVRSSTRRIRGEFAPSRRRRALESRRVNTVARARRSCAERRA